MTIEEIDRKMEFMSKVKKLLVRDPVNMTEYVLQKYVETGKTQEVAQWLNDNGYRISGVRGSRRYVSTDITEIISNASDVDTELLLIVKRMQKSGRLLERHFD